SPPAAASAAPTAAPVAGPVTIRVFAAQEPSDKGMEYSDLPTNSLTKELEAKFNVHFEWQLTSFDAAAAKQKRLTAFASGDEPDLFLLVPWVDTFSPAELIQYGKQGAI